jgi:hypothetical protein
MRATPTANTLFYGYDLHILREHIADHTVDLLYLDPPFNSNATSQRADSPPPLAGEVARRAGGGSRAATPRREILDGKRLEMPSLNHSVSKKGKRETAPTGQGDLGL